MYKCECEKKMRWCNNDTVQRYTGQNFSWFFVQVKNITLIVIYYIDRIIIDVSSKVISEP